MTQTTRPRVFEAIDSERTYQKLKWGTDEKNPVASYLTFMRYHMARAEELASTLHTHEEALHQIRKVTALGVACMEEHGAPLRDLDSALLPLKPDGTK